MLRNLVPRGLLGRFLLILVVPLVVLQAITAQVFFDRHWDTVVRRLAIGIAGDVAAVVDLLVRFPDSDQRMWIFGLARDRMRLDIVFSPGEILPNTPVPEAGERAADVLAISLRESLQRPVIIEAGFFSGDINISVQLSDGVLHVVAPRKRLFTSTTYIFLLWMVGASLILLGVAILFTSNQVRSIRRLAASAEGFGKGRDLPPIKPEGAREVRQAGIAFNQMRARIRRQIDQRTEMLAGVSHDLRTPLTRMRLQLAMMGDGAEISDLKDDIAEMERMLDGYLDFARGEGTETAAETDLSDLVDRMAGRFRRHGVSVELAALPDEPVLLTVRALGLERALANLLSNAARYGTRVRLGLGLGEEWVDIVVEDDGPGIPLSLREDVFRPFWRGEPSRNSQTGGIGLGLSIAREMAHAHGGEILLDESPLGGLKAVVHLPR